MVFPFLFFSFGFGGGWLGVGTWEEIILEEKTVFGWQWILRPLKAWPCLILF